MKKIAIFVCGEVAEKCIAHGCFRAFNEKIDSFEEYKEEKVQLTAFNTCIGCNKEPLENLKMKIPKMRKQDIEVVHISTCIRGRCENYPAFAKELAMHFEVIGYTHGSKEGKKGNTINFKKPKEFKYKEMERIK